MKATCNIIRDLLPLYVEGLVSHDTEILVEEHLEDCNECKKELEALKGSRNLPMDTNVGPLKAVERKLAKKRNNTIILTTVLVLIVGIISISYLTLPEYLSFSEGIVNLKEQENGSIVITFSDRVAGYDIDKYKETSGDAYVYSLTAWNSTWKRHFSKRDNQSIVINPDGSAVKSIYYYSTDGKEDMLIYGQNINENGGVITLPRLVLGYYLFIAFLLAIIGGLFVLVFRKRVKVREKLFRITMLPIAYIISHLSTKRGLISYSAQRDFSVILLVTILIYVLLILANRFFKPFFKKAK